MFDETGGGGLTQVDHGLLRSGAIEAGQTAEELNGLLSGTLEQLAPLATAWVGTAGTTYQNIQNALAENMRTLYAALTSIADSMGISADEFAMTDEEIASDLAATGAMEPGDLTRLLGQGDDIENAVESGASNSQITEAMNN
ncbi:MAG TPA: WXG100 family type VII secretion target [Natronosporangium sp.]